MADNIEDLKRERSSAKRAVSIAANRLQHGVQLRMDSVYEMSKKLDEKYCDFLDAAKMLRLLSEEGDINPEQFVVSNMSIDDYEYDVKQTYECAIAAYRTYVTSVNTSSNVQQNPQTTSASVMLKKRDLPKFSGKSKDWPEFKSIWQKIVVPSIHNRTALAFELKLSCKDGKAYAEIENISAGAENAYDNMWAALSLHYDNVTLAVSCALDEIRLFKQVHEEDYSGIVKLIRQIDSVYQQLLVLNQAHMVTNREVSVMMSYFPPTIKKDWAEFHCKLDCQQQLAPFGFLQEFLSKNLKIAKHLADMQIALKPNKHNSKQTQSCFNVKSEKTKFAKCCVHDSANHTTELCKLFTSLSVDERKNRLMKSGRCFRCFGNHKRSSCKEDTSCELCGRNTHHKLMCVPFQERTHCDTPLQSVNLNANSSDTNTQIGCSSHVTETNVVSNAVNRGSALTLYAIYETPVASSNQKAVVFCDDGADSTFISEAGVRKLKARKLSNISIDMTTINGTQPIHTSLYEVILITVSGRKIPVNAFCLPRLSGPVSQFNDSVLSQLFPRFDAKVLKRPTAPVDLLLGGDYFGLHPKRELASDQNNLSVMQGELGVCIQGSHPLIREATEKDSHVGYCVRVVSSHRVTSKVLHREFNPLLPTQGLVSEVRSCEASRQISACIPRPASREVCSSRIVPATSLQASSINSTAQHSPEGFDKFSVCQQSESTNLKFTACQKGTCFQSDDNVSQQSPDLDIHNDVNEQSSKSEIDSDVTRPILSVSELNGPPDCQSNLVRLPRIVEFITGENLGTEVIPKCGSCKCGKCPMVGHTYSFREEQELKLINSKLHYDAENECWIAGYPWLTDPALLPDNYAAAFATLRSTEKRLKAEPEWARKYSDQIHDMEERGAARKLSLEEMETWKGSVFYLSHLAVEQPKSVSTPIRIVFNSSQVYKGVSLNSFLAKGPDTFKNNLLGMLLRFREEPVVLKGDIRKMYNSVFLGMLEQQTHRFLWRDMEDRPPDTWSITRVNMGDKPAGAIAIEAKDRTADLFRYISPKAADFIRDSAYVDDLIDSVRSYPEAKQLAIEADHILAKGGFRVKGWLFGGQRIADATDEVQHVLGVSWVPSEDVIVFQAVLNFSRKRRNVRTGSDLLQSDVPDKIPPVLTRRIVLEQVMGVFDPYGLLAPFILLAKIYLRETWTLHLDWDDALPDILCAKWRKFFTTIFTIEKHRYDRCLKPAGAIGDPLLVLFSDGSEMAYGCAAYIRWTLDDGSFWSRLILAKCRIAPVNRISIPQMELNGAVLSKRCRKVIESECRFQFAKVLQLVDSETVLYMINKLSTRFRVYEGVRIGEIQASTGGDVSCWGWISAAQNIADWVTRGRPPSDLGPDSEWFRGPDFLRKPYKEWNVRFSRVQQQPSEALPGERVNVDSRLVVLAKFNSYSRCSSLRVIRWVYARIISMFQVASFKGGHRANVTPELLASAERILILDAQNSEWTAKTVRSHFRTLLPVKQDGYWVVGTRISHQSPLTPENKAQILLPSKHALTRLFMVEAHNGCGHRGRDVTAARFRSRFWTSHATKISKAVCDGCQLCKLLYSKRMSQLMGRMPAARLVPAPPFSSIMLDLFGPYLVRGEVQKRTTGKAWGVIFTDLCCRAVHIEVVFGYDTKSFLLALSRFVAIRGWPSVIYSDPGTQLVGANAELKRVWNEIDKDALKCQGAEVGLRWEFGPADSPWYQGAVESLVKSAKRAIELSVKSRRLSVPEILTVCTQAADLLNERPIGILPSPDSPLNILTPNSLLLGRSTSRNPGGYESNPTLLSRLTLVQSIVEQFWHHWTNLYAPTLIRQSKWLHVQRDLQIGDVVIVADSGVLKGEYRLARVTSTFRGADGKVRRVRVAYKRYKVGEKVFNYTGAGDIEIERSVNKLALLVPVEGIV